jgi:surface antigen
MKVLLAGLVLLVTFPAVVGSAAAAIATAPHPAPTAPVFAFVPHGGFPDEFPFGQCTLWAAYNRRVTWNGNAADWIANARAQGVATTDAPSVGAIAVYAPGGTYHPLYGHVAVVIAVTPTTYTVSEMNFIGWGRVSTRVIPWPDPEIDGFIPVRPEDVK